MSSLWLDAIMPSGPCHCTYQLLQQDIAVIELGKNYNSVVRAHNLQKGRWTLVAMCVCVCGGGIYP